MIKYSLDGTPGPVATKRIAKISPKTPTQNKAKPSKKIEIVIHKVVIHELVKDQHKPIKPPNLRKKTLNPKLDPVQKLVDGVASLYGKKNNTAHYGTFRTDEARGDFPDEFEKYAAISNRDDRLFIDLSKTAMNALQRSAEVSMASSGGYILFADYHNAQGRFFLVAMIKQKDGLTLSEQLVPEELSELDLSRLYQAAKINFSKLSAYRVADDADRQELNYLSFVSPSSNKSAAGYFVTALGCAPGTAAARATNNVVTESTRFFRQHEKLKTFWQEFKKELLFYLWEKSLAKESAKLSEVEKIARKYIPADSSQEADKIADDFVTRLNSEECAVPVEFPVNMTVLKKHRQIRYTSDELDISFDRSALGEDEDAKVFYDRENKSITLNSVPAKLINLIHEELDSHKASKQ